MMYYLFAYNNMCFGHCFAMLLLYYVMKKGVNTKELVIIGLDNVNKSIPPSFYKETH